MGFHIDSVTEDGRPHRTGTYQSAHEALAAAVRRKAPALVFDDPSDSISRGSGAVVAAVKNDGTIIEDPAKPVWWDRVDESVKTRLLESDSQDIDVVAIAKAGGVSVATSWGSEPATGWRLSSEDEDWIAFEIVRSAVQI